MIKISIIDAIRNSCPQFIGAAVSAKISNTPHNTDLWKEIVSYYNQLNDSETIADIKQNKAIEWTRKAYKSLGKDPNRYRPSSESLRRRILRGLPLYEVNTIVDLINFVSMKSGYTMSGLDADKIIGDTLTLDIGKDDVMYLGIGKGLINIDHIPVYRDNEGGIATPTSDNERTKLEENSKNLLLIINAFDGEKIRLSETIEWTIDLLKQYVSAKEINLVYF